MKVKELTGATVLEAAKGASSISEVARRLGVAGKKLDGKTSKKLRALVPELDEMLAQNKATITASTEPTPAQSAKVSPNEKPADGNPYRAGSTYATIFDVGSKGFLTKTALIAKAASVSGKSPKCITFSLTVLTNRKHSSNVGRSTALLEDGKIKLVALRRG